MSKVTCTNICIVIVTSAFEKLNVYITHSNAIALAISQLHFNVHSNAFINMATTCVLVYKNVLFGFGEITIVAVGTALKAYQQGLHVCIL